MGERGRDEYGEGRVREREELDAYDASPSCLFTSVGVVFVLSVRPNRRPVAYCAVAVTPLMRPVRRLR